MIDMRLIKGRAQILPLLTAWVEKGVLPARKIWCPLTLTTNLKHEGGDSLETANSVMKEVWMNARESCGKTVTINRNFLYSLLLKLEKENFDSGYHLGYSHRGKVQEDELPIDSNFKDLTVEW